MYAVLVLKDIVSLLSFGLEIIDIGLPKVFLPSIYNNQRFPNPTAIDYKPADLAFSR